MKLARPERTEKEASTNSTGKGNLYSLKKKMYLQRLTLYIFGKGITSETLSHAVKQTAHFSITMIGTPMSGHRRSSDGSLGEFHTTTTLFR